MEQLTDEELLAIIADGRGAMPGFKTLLNPEELAALVKLMRDLSADSIP
jgi:mono/diheme cytochrome c family protein